MPYDHLKYRTRPRIPHITARGQPDDGLPAVEPAQAALGHPLDLDDIAGQERGDGRRGGLGRDLWKGDLPPAPPEPVAPDSPNLPSYEDEPPVTPID